GALYGGGYGGHYSTFTFPLAVGFAGAVAKLAIIDFAQGSDNLALGFFALANHGGEVFEHENDGLTVQQSGAGLARFTRDEATWRQVGDDNHVGETADTVHCHGSLAATGRADNEHPHGVSTRVVGVDNREHHPQCLQVRVVEVLNNVGSKFIPKDLLDN